MRNQNILGLLLTKKLIHFYLTITMLIILPLTIFTYHLDKNPPGFFIDESIYGFEAYSILKTKGFSSSGEFLPLLFLNPGETIRNHSIYTYFVIPFIAMFGLNEFSVRLTSVIFSISLFFIIYILLRNKASEFSILLASFMWPLTSWVFLLSRIGMEFIATGFFYILTIYLLNKIHALYKDTQLKYYVFSLGIAIFFLFYIYAAGKILALGLMCVAIILFLRKRISMINILILLILFSITLFMSVNYIRDKSFFYRVDELKQCKQYIPVCLLKNFATHFSYRSYFSNTYIPPDFSVLTHSIMGTSLIPKFLLPFLLIGSLLLLFKASKGDFFSRLLLLSFFLGTVPASLTIRGFDSYRSVALVPILYIAIVYGIDVVFNVIKKLPPVIFSITIFALITLILYAGIQELKILVDYEKKTVVATYSGWQFGFRQIFQYFTQHSGYYNKLIATNSIAYLPNLYMRFYDPENNYKKNLLQGHNENSRILGVSDDNQQVLYALRPDEISFKNFLIKKIIYYPNGTDIAFYIGIIKQQMTLTKNHINFQKR